MIRSVGASRGRHPSAVSAGCGRPPRSMDEPELDPGSLLLAQGFHGAWFPARVVQAHSTSVLVALQSDVEEHSEWVALGSGRCSPGTPNPAP
jgi:hypothetical protein